MLKEIYFTMGPVKSKLLINDGGLFWQMWKWKLDSYVVKEESCNIQIDLTNSDRELELNELLSEKKAGFFSHRVYSTNDDGMIWQYERIKNGHVVLKYFVSSSWNEIELLEDNSDTGGDLSFEYLGMIMPSVMLNYDILNFHGVLMEYQGQGIIISANSGTGKTTHARLWRDYKNALIINGDRSTCQNVDGVWMGYGLPWSGTSGEQVNRHVPLKALVVLERSSENEAHVLSLEEKLSYVLPHVLYPSWDGELVGKMLDLLDDFLMNIPVIRLGCRPDVESVEVLSKVLEDV